MIENHAWTITQHKSFVRAPKELHAGDLVEVLSPQEILATLDEHGELESLPFMPEMLQFCGRRFYVDKIAVKACDTITNINQGLLKEMSGALAYATVSFAMAQEG